MHLTGYRFSNTRFTCAIDRSANYDLQIFLDFGVQIGYIALGRNSHARWEELG
jgi:hypothetical protein